MSGKIEISPIIKGVHSQIANTMSEIFFDGAEMALVNFIENGFLQTMFSKSGDASHAVTARLNAYKMALYNNEQEALGLSDLDDLDDSAKDCDTDIIENMPDTLTSNPILILQHELPDVGVI
ncbi:unnamed protein product [Rhizophagus irregularis]|uniref:Uncharacterized protein n=1 Tax=Rhizophagus irregularis TaxID=588596 RepID=A0A2N1NRD0_9GLOM|nr:hypothetical protein RhiirC2_772577 [Rhizophagus irregularis]CAB4374190.1 unnamed protein product [Rhizophagus irregularis]CAB5317889.1 unnamed protein product [Rhizophagus irregularis]